MVTCAVLLAPVLQCMGRWVVSGMGPGHGHSAQVSEWTADLGAYYRAGVYTCAHGPFLDPACSE